HASLRNGCRIRAAAGSARSTGAARRLSAQLVNRWHVDAQDVNGTVSGIRRSRAPVRAAFRARDRDGLNAHSWRDEQAALARRREPRLPGLPLLGRENELIDLILVQR